MLDLQIEQLVPLLMDLMQVQFLYASELNELWLQPGFSNHSVDWLSYDSGPVTAEFASEVESLVRLTEVWILEAESPVQGSIRVHKADLRAHYLR